MKAALRPVPVPRDRPTPAYCGPVALAALTGCPVEDVEAAIRVVRKAPPRAPVTGTRVRELKAAAGLLGFRLVDVPLAGLLGDGSTAGCGERHAGPRSRLRPTLASMMRRRGAALWARPLFVRITGHFVAVQGERFVDTARREGCAASQAPRRRARVSHVLVALGPGDSLAPGEFHRCWRWGLKSGSGRPDR